MTTGLPGLDPVQGASGGGGGGDVNLTQVAGASVQTGHGVAAGALRVELPTDGTGQVGVNSAAGTAINATVAAYGLLPVGGWSARVAQAVTTTIATYTTGQNIGGLLTLTSVTPNADQRFILQTVSLACKSTQTVPIDVIFFTANPTGSTITNAAALVIATADYDKISEVVHISDWTALNTASFAQADNLARLMSPTSGSANLYAAIVARGSIASGTTSEMTLNVKTASV